MTELSWNKVFYKGAYTLGQPQKGEKQVTDLQLNVLPQYTLCSYTKK